MARCRCKTKTKFDTTDRDKNGRKEDCHTRLLTHPNSLSIAISTLFADDQDFTNTVRTL